MATTVRLSPDPESRLQPLANASGSSADALLGRVINESLQDIEDAQLAESAWLGHEGSGEPTITLDDVLSRCGLEA
ncbi:hypothetical protein KBY97_13620 [Synechococcus sp. ATX 2A4]|uniref:type II toxin-antitoxin system RelB family antitoxin n=1 Tax=Synechococcus sp. ATX 2A4 TaxID=2823727 RepID=UPI0020CD0174|nr:hypothetical protein [Synechococcus sp. ATX 2A4]MCP9886152.1 hypothetical protein [Synechococcus sp. ATX 2A4]